MLVTARHSTRLGSFMATRSALSDDGSGEAADDEYYSSDGSPYTTTSLDDALSFMNDVELELRLPSQESPAQENRVPSSHSSQQAPAARTVKRPKRPRSTSTAKATTQRFVRRKTTSKRLQTRSAPLDLSELRCAELSCASSRSSSDEPSSRTTQPIICPPPSQQEQEQNTSDASSALHANAAMWLNQAAQQYEQLQQTESAHDRVRATLSTHDELAKLLDDHVQAQSALLVRRYSTHLDHPTRLQRLTASVYLSLWSV